MWAQLVSHLLICVLGRQQGTQWPILSRNERNSETSSLLSSGTAIFISSRVQEESAVKTLNSLTDVRCHHSMQAAEKHGLRFWLQKVLTVSSRVTLWREMPPPLDVWEKAICKCQKTEGCWHIPQTTLRSLMSFQHVTWTAAGMHEAKVRAGEWEEKERTHSEVVKRKERKSMVSIRRLWCPGCLMIEPPLKALFRCSCG